MKKSGNPRRPGNGSPGMKTLNPTYVPVGLPEVRHRQTNRQTDAILSQYRAVHSIAREKEIIIGYHEFDFMICRPTS